MSVNVSPPLPSPIPYSQNLPCNILAASRVVLRTFVSYKYVTVNLFKMISRFLMGTYPVANQNDISRFLMGTCPVANQNDISRFLMGTCPVANQNDISRFLMGTCPVARHNSY